jgi:hypothetical protein
MTFDDALAPVHAAASNVYELGVFGKEPPEGFCVFGVKRNDKRIKNVAGLIISGDRDGLVRTHSHGPTDLPRVSAADVSVQVGPGDHSRRSGALCDVDLFQGRSTPPADLPSVICGRKDVSPLLAPAWQQVVKVAVRTALHDCLRPLESDARALGDWALGDWAISSAQ